MPEILEKAIATGAATMLVCLIYFGIRRLLKPEEYRKKVNRCRHCGIEIKKKDIVITCPVCSSIYHAECYRIHEGCANSCEE